MQECKCEAPPRCIKPTLNSSIEEKLAKKNESNLLVFPIHSSSSASMVAFVLVDEEGPAGGKPNGLFPLSVLCDINVVPIVECSELKGTAGASGSGGCCTSIEAPKPCDEAPELPSIGDDGGEDGSWFTGAVRIPLLFPMPVPPNTKGLELMAVEEFVPASASWGPP